MKIQEKIGAGVLSLGLVIGLSGFAGATTGTIDTTGPDSTNTIKSKDTQRVDVDNNNRLNVHNNNNQSAWTGEAEVHNNTRGGDAETGAAMNDNSFDASVSVDNSAAVKNVVRDLGGDGSDNRASIENTGPDSTNRVTFENSSKVDVDNNNTLRVSNNSNQTASSGDATVSHNTTGGDATTGDASNTNSTSVKFDITN